MPEIEDYARRFHSSGGSTTLFQIARQDVGLTSYFLYVNNDGKWYMMRSVVVGAVTTYNYANDGARTLSQAWTDRASLSYAEYNEVFG